MSIKKRLLAMMMIVAGLCFITGVIGILGQGRIIRMVGNLLEKDLVVLTTVSEMAELNLQLRRYEKDFLINIGKTEKQATYRQKFDRSAADMQASIDTLLQVKNRNGKKKLSIEVLLDECNKTFGAYKAGAYNVMDKVTADATVTTAQGNAMMGEFKNATHTFEQTIAGMNEKVVADFAVAEKEMMDASRQSILFTTIIVISSVIIAVVLSVGTGKRIANPITAVAAHLQRMGEGDFTVQVEQELLSRSDEIGMVASSADKLSHKMHSVISDLSTSAQTVAASATELSSTSVQIANGAEEMSSQTAMVSTAANETKSGVQTVSGVAGNMAESVTSFSATIEEMNASLSEVAKSCQKELEITSEAARHASSTQEIMGKLGEASKSIGNVVDLINNIADQTNLLALNATIEAASAGDAGKGFSVVANEVKELAQQTASATKDIEGKVREMQNNSDASVTAIAKVAEVIDEVTSISQTIVSAVEEQSATLSEIAKNIVFFDNGTKEVAATISGSASSLSEVTTAISGVNESVAETARGIENIKGSSGELANLSEQLNRMVKEFRI